jgi:YgiT-type zinc finger domain-containing protein
MASDVDAPHGQASVPCPRCQTPLVATTVRTAIWRGDSLAVVEDIPAHVCSTCMEQFYDENVSEALRRLSEAGFPPAEARREVVVPVFSLEGRIPTGSRATLPDDTFVD